MAERAENFSGRSGVIEIECSYLEPHIHSFPEDWKFAGANGLHPGADERWSPTTYTYYDESLTPIFTTSAPTCDEQAVDEFSRVAALGIDWNPIYISAKRRGELVGTMLPFRYSKTDDTVRDIVRAST